jgi:hypothetical protein
MIVAYFIMLHHKLEQFRWLFEAIYSSEDLFLIHIDRTSPLAFHRAVEAYIGDRSNVEFLPAHRVAWGGWSLVVPGLRAIDFFLRCSRYWSYYINLSGQDYPIKPRGAIRDTLKESWPRNFVGVGRFADIRISEPDDPHLERRLTFDLFGRRRLETPFRLPAPTAINMDYKGPAWHILDRDFCRWMMNAPVRRAVERYLRWTLLPEEVFFQAMIMNSPFADTRIDHCGHEVIWPGPKVLDSGDYDHLMRSPALFARKFDEAKDPNILRRLAKSGGYAVPPILEGTPNLFATPIL